ncbi:hypothetical protein EI94DRAFT_1120059 [Lactarius quietus]|nr:hypothetical protein EI94DRAFT_1120059 [Lactarius quietus]
MAPVQRMAVWVCGDGGSVFYILGCGVNALTGNKHSRVSAPQGGWSRIRAARGFKSSFHHPLTRIFDWFEQRFEGILSSLHPHRVTLLHAVPSVAMCHPKKINSGSTLMSKLCRKWISPRRTITGSGNGIRCLPLFAIRYLLHQTPFCYLAI